MSRVMSFLKTGLKWLLVTLLVVLLLMVLVVGAILLALRSDAGTVWVLEQIPGLETTGARGSLLGEWQAEGLTWQGYGVTVAVESPLIIWRPACLFRQRVCLQRLEAASLDVNLTDTGAEDEGSSGGLMALPDVALPVNIDIGAVELGAFHLNDTLVWEQLSLGAEGGGSDFYIRKLTLAREQVSLALDGRLETRGDWPLALDLDLQLPPPYGERWQVAGQLRGSVRDLRANLTSSGYLDGTLNAELAPLDPSLPASLDFRSDRFLALDTLPETLTLQSWTLNARGNLDNGYRIDTQATLPGQQGDIGLDVSGRVTQTEAEQLQVLLSGPSLTGEGQAELRVEGQVAWQDTLTAEADVTMGAFPWFSLLPGVEPPPVTIQSLEASAQYAEDQYQATLNLQATGPMGDSTLDTRVDGDLQSVSLTELVMTTGAGRLQGDAEVGFARQPSWQADLSLQDFNPGFWVPQAEASISGSVMSEGQLDPQGTPDFTASWDLQGQWHEAPLVSRGSIEAASGQWQIPEVLASVGDNRVTASGELQDPLGPSGELSIQGQLELPEPGLIVPGLAGTAEARISLAGPIRLPGGNVELSANGLAWKDQVSIGQLDLQARLDDSQSLKADLSVSSLEAGGQTVEQAEAGLTGTLDDHRLTLSVRHPAAEVEAALAGAWQADGGQWRGQLASGEVTLPGPGQTWELESPAPLNYVDETLTLGAHCWRWQDSTLCAGDQTLFPDTALAMEISQFPTSALAPLLPETVRWDAMINGSLDVELADEGPRGTVQIGADPGEVVVTLGEEQETLSYQTLNLGLDMDPQVANATLTFKGQDVGTVSVDLTVDPTAADLPSTGSFSLEGFDLEMLGAFVDLQDIGGQIAGSGRLEGPLMAPHVYGQVSLSDGRLIDEKVPIPIEDLNLQVNFNGSQAGLDGSWQSNGTGTGEIGGNVDWSGDPEFTVTLNGEGLPLHYEPYADLQVSPDLEIGMAGGQLSVSGRIAIPRGKIEVRELPEQAVAVSEDEVIVGDEAESEPGLSLAMNVTVVVGEEEVTFEGFGVTGELEGELTIGNNMDTRGSLQLVNGQYEAFGQELEIRRARLVFLGPVSEPYLDIEAIRKVDTVVAGIRLTGSAREPETQVFSEPAMSQNEALSYLILGRPLQSQGDQNQVSRMALALGLNRASGLTRGIGEAFGIKDLTLEAEGSGDDSAVVASGYLTEDLSIRYGVGLFEPVTTVALRYDLGRYFYIEAASGLAASLDIFYNRDF